MLENEFSSEDVGSSLHTHSQTSDGERVERIRRFPAVALTSRQKSGENKFSVNFSRVSFQFTIKIGVKVEFIEIGLCGL